MAKLGAIDIFVRKAKCGCCWEGKFTITWPNGTFTEGSCGAVFKTEQIAAEVIKKSAMEVVRMIESGETKIDLESNQNQEDIVQVNVMKGQPVKPNDSEFLH